MKINEILLDREYLILSNTNYTKKDYLNLNIEDTNYILERIAENKKSNERFQLQIHGYDISKIKYYKLEPVKKDDEPEELNDNDKKNLTTALDALKGG